MTNPGSAPRSKPQKRSGRPLVTIRHGSASIPIYGGKVRDKARYTIAFYRNGRRERRTFGSLDKAKREARIIAQQIQNGNQHAHVSC